MDRVAEEGRASAARQVERSGARRKIGGSRGVAAVAGQLHVRGVDGRQGEAAARERRRVVDRRRREQKARLERLEQEGLRLARARRPDRRASSPRENLLQRPGNERRRELPAQGRKAGS